MLSWQGWFVHTKILWIFPPSWVLVTGQDLPDNFCTRRELFLCGKSSPVHRKCLTGLPTAQFKSYTLYVHSCRTLCPTARLMLNYLWQFIKQPPSGSILPICGHDGLYTEIQSREALGLNRAKAGRLERWWKKAVFLPVCVTSLLVVAF